MDSNQESSLIEILNTILKESSQSISTLKDLSDESKVISILNAM